MDDPLQNLDDKAMARLFVSTDMDDPSLPAMRDEMRRRGGVFAEIAGEPNKTVKTN